MILLYLGRNDPARNLFRGGDDEDDSADADTNDPVVPRYLHFLPSPLEMI
jgi:hypothetical protein